MLSHHLVHCLGQGKEIRTSEWKEHHLMSFPKSISPTRLSLFTEHLSLPVCILIFLHFISFVSLLYKCQLAAPASQLLLCIWKRLGDNCFKYSAHIDNTMIYILNRYIY